MRMTCVECKANRSDQMKRIYYEHKEELEKAYQQGGEDAIDDAFNRLWKLATSKYDEVLCLEELSNDIDTIKAQIKSNK